MPPEFVYLCSASIYYCLPNSRAGTGRRCSSIWHSAREGPRVPNAEIENPARLLERQKMPAACRPKNEAANFIFPPWIRLFFRYPCVPPTPLQLSSVAMTSHTCLAGVPHDAWSGRVPTAGSRSVYSRFQSPLQVVAVRLDKLAVFVVGGETARWS